MTGAGADSPRGALSLNEVLAGMSREMASLGARAERIEAALFEARPPAMPRAEGDGIRGRIETGGARDLQDLDLLRQVLADLARLLSHLAATVEDQPLDPDAIRAALRLRSLADRLLAGAPTPPVGDRACGTVTLF